MISYQPYLVHILLTLLLQCNAAFTFGIVETSWSLFEAVVPGQNMISRV